MAEQTVTQKINASIPADATGAFVGIMAALNQTQASLATFAAWASFATIVVIAALLPLYSRKLLNITSNGRIWFLVATFVIWSLSIVDTIHYQNLFDSVNLVDKDVYVLASIRIVVILWTFLAVPVLSVITTEKAAAAETTREGQLA